jgi:hypothetical protein
MPTAKQPNEGDLAQQPGIELSRLNLTEVPPELVDSEGLEELILARNKIRSVPAWIGRLSGLRGLDLSSNLITDLPAELETGTQPNSLYVVGQGMVDFAPKVGELPALRTLNLAGNQISDLPMWLPRLARLVTLNLAGNRLGNGLKVVGRLLSLRSLNLSDNNLETLADEVCNVNTLTSLDLSHNRLTELPDTFIRLANLQELNLEGNQLERLPHWISRLTKLQTLNLAHNRLTDLPPAIAPLLSSGLAVSLEGNPLRDPLPDLVERGADALAAFLLSLEDAVPQYEVKMMLVGEGKVGKSSLVAALRDKPFVPDRKTTHGIEIHPLTLPHPELEVEMTVRSWDFGGQEVYRITHQFFFSRRSLYLLVWNPRVGQEQSEVEGWLRRIRLRVGQDARVLVIATHCEERRPELAYPRLERDFGAILVGQYAVDNRTGSGVAQLRGSLAKQASQLPQMGQLLSPRWIAARDEILTWAEDEPQIPFDQFAAACERHGVVGNEVATLAELLHDLGQVIYYGDDDGLRDVVVLRPEWLTKAISYVLEDTAAREAGGILDHTRLADIWLHRSDGEGYHPRYYPYFLRLMEKFDVSYRLASEPGHSLVAQLVPYQPPEVPWERGTAAAEGTRKLSLICELAEPAPGLIAWLTVRHYQSSTRRHWRNGVFLRHPIKKYASEAMLELITDSRLAIDVRAPSPAFFFNVLLDSVEALIRLRWPGLRYVLYVPCPGAKDGAACEGLFRLEGLLRYQERGGVIQNCLSCNSDYDVSILLTGFAAPTVSLQPALEQLRDDVDRLASGVGRVEQFAADSAHSIRRLVKTVSTEVTDCPRLFTIAPGHRSGVRGLRMASDEYVLTLWCEHPGHWHPVRSATYRFDKPREWLVRIKPYGSLVLSILGLVVPISGAVEGVVSSADKRERAAQEIELMRSVLDEKPASPPDDDDDTAADEDLATLEPAEGHGLRQFRALLFSLDIGRHFGGLRRVHAASGEFLWVCPAHYSKYDPGLPTIELE